MLRILAFVLFALGGLICLLNFYLSFVRYPLHRLRGRPADTYHWVSGFPLVGTVFVAVALALGLRDGAWLIASLVLIALDTGGPLWGVPYVAWMWWRERRSRR